MRLLLLNLLRMMDEAMDKMKAVVNGVMIDQRLHHLNDVFDYHLSYYYYCFYDSDIRWECLLLMVAVAMIFHDGHLYNRNLNGIWIKV